MSTDWRKDPRYQGEPKTGLTAYQLRRHLAEDHGKPTRGLDHQELVRIHERLHPRKRR
jgi:hypothetical protein